MADPESGLGTEAPAEERCYRHPNEVTRVHCTRCGRPICPDCMHPAPVGHHCPTCVGEARREARVGPGRRARVMLGRPGGVTTLLLGAILAMFAVEVVVGGPQSLMSGPPVQKLIRLGATAPSLIAGGQWWRLITATFLHAGILHLLLNGYALYLLGFLVEGVYGKGRFLAIYLITGFLASVASYQFSGLNTVGVGASGAIFGLLGTWLAYNFRRRELATAAANLRWVLTILLINLVLGFSIRGIDNSAHIGGFLAGILAGTLAEGFGRGPARRLVQVGGLIALVLLGVVVTMARTAAIHDMVGLG
ncbi:MAG TPA: rhomboid family intramembrane serine protease [Actinomycetota bacterium]|nr:rhomboid family intramembrane serine protease [Actinomycetota bacterium]